MRETKIHFELKIEDELSETYKLFDSEFVFFTYTNRRLIMVESKKIEEVQKKIGRAVEETGDVIQEKVEKTYDDLIDRVRDERDWIERELRHEYRNARRFVRANPERGIGIALAAGIVIGILLGRSTK